MRGFSFAHLSVLALAINLAACGDSESTSAVAPSAAPVAATVTAVPATPAADVQAVSREQVINHYAEIAHATFADALTTAQALQQAVKAFLAAPSADTQHAAKEAWLAARVPYMQSEVFRFGNAFSGWWEGQVKCMPLDEGLIGLRRW